MYKRTLNIAKLLKNKSFFLFGPRSTGKTTLIEQQLPYAKIYDLLDADIYRALLKRPKIIEEESSDPKQIIVIDEIQKLPSLLDEVHRLIHKKNMRFLLTGSSSRKLKRGAANLLAGRAWEARLYPLTSREIPDFDLNTYLNCGGLPQVYGNPNQGEELDSYISTYLQEEIKAEAATRNVQAFAEFLDTIALANGQEINYEGLASDCQVSPGTLKNYIQILEDTLIGFRLPGYRKTKKRKAITRAKHFLFDIGVTNILCQRGKIKEKSELFGLVFEHFIILEVRAYLSYVRNKMKLCYWRSVSKMEVDLIIGNELAIEIKSSFLVTDKHFKGLRALMEEQIFNRFIIVSLDINRRTTSDGIEILPWQMFLDQLWNNKLISTGN